MSEFSPITYTISLPHDNQWDGKRAHQFIDQLLLGFPHLIFRIIGTSRHVQWQLVDLVGYDDGAIENAVRATYPEVTITSTMLGSGEFSDHYPIYRTVLKYHQAAETFLAPILYAPDIKHPDPLRSIVEVMGNLLDGERVIYHLFIDGIAMEAYEEGEKQLTKKIVDGSLLGWFRPEKVDRYTPEITSVLSAKLQERLYRASLFIQIESPNLDRFSALLTLDNHIVNYSRPRFGRLAWIDDGQRFQVITDDTMEWQSCALAQYDAITYQKGDKGKNHPLKQGISLVLEPREIATLWHLPHEGFSTATIEWSHATVRLPSVLHGKSKGVCLGVNVFAGREEKVFLPDRSGHISIIGKTGVGKTTLMHQLIHQDIATGKGVAVIDPHGQLVTDTLRYSIPSDREKDVIVLDLADESYPIPLNPLSVSQGIDPGNAAGQLIGVLDRLYDLSSTPTVADTLWASLATLLHDEHSTIRDVGRLLQNSPYRLGLLSKVTNVAAIEFWDRFEAQTGNKDHLIRPVLWRLRGLYGNSLLYPILCHPDALDLTSIIAQNKILLVSLKADERRIPIREQYLVGLLLLTMIQQTVMARSPRQDAYYLYIDEVQHFVTTTFDILLSEARKYGLSLTTANQYLKQLTGNMLDTVMGNVGTMVSFQCGLDDARLLAPYFEPGFDAKRLMHLNAYEAALVTRYGSQSLPAFSLKTLPPVGRNISLNYAQVREKYLRELSRQTHTSKSREEVLAWLSERYTRPAIESIGEVVDFE